MTAPDGNTATVTFAPLDVPPLGDTSDGATVTTALRRPDGTNVTVPSLIAVAVDGQRMVFLQQVRDNAAPLDEAASPCCSSGRPRPSRPSNSASRARRRDAAAVHRRMRERCGRFVRRVKPPGQVP